MALLILLAMTILGVATLSSVNMQERMAGNATLQSLAFEAAAAGLSEALQWAFVPSAGLAFSDCSRKAGPWVTEQPWAAPPRELDLDEKTSQTVRIEYSLRNDCLEDPDYDEIVTLDGSPFQPPVQLFVTSEGTVFAADNTPLARREIEVRIDNLRGDGLSAVRVEGQAQVDFNAANSNSFVVEGGGGPAISTSTSANATLIVRDILNKDRIGNYDGGVVSSPYPPPFDTAVGLAQLVLRIRAYMEYSNVPDTVGVNIPTATQVPTIDDCSNTHTWRFVDGDLDLGNRALGTVANPQITYIAGDLSMGGNASGAGLLIVEGTIDSNGTPGFSGLIIALGGSVDLSGGGQGVTEGMVFATNLNLDSLKVALNDILVNTNEWFVDEDYSEDLTDPNNPIVVFRPGIYQQLMALEPYQSPYTPSDLDLYLDYPDALGVGTNSTPGGSDIDGFGATILTFGGGGNHSIVYECGEVEKVRQFLDTCEAEDPSAYMINALLVADWASFECDVPGRGAAIASIRSWRENLGWRELLQ